jgi:molybdopterin synthase catalytic subunit
MDYLKSQAPFWKKQKSENESSWIESRDIDKAALDRWQES